MTLSKIINLGTFRNKLRVDVFKKILKYNLNATNEKTLIIGDEGFGLNLISPLLTKAYSLAAQEVGLNFETIYQNYKGRGDNADELLISKLKKLPPKSIIILNVSNRIGRLDTLGLSFRKFAQKNRHRFISSSSFGSIPNNKLDFVIDCLDIDYKQVSKETEKIAKRLTDAREIHVSTKAGTDITYNVEGIISKIATGVYREPGTGGNLPGSEAYIAPNGSKVNGKLVIDGSSRIKNNTMLVKNPIKLEIKNGLITKISDNSEARKLKETLMWSHNISKNPEGSCRIGEFGIGMNKRAKIIGSTIIDEKTYGSAHFAIGSNHWFGGNIRSLIHLDQVIRKPLIKIDGKILAY